MNSLLLRLPHSEERAGPFSDKFSSPREVNFSATAHTRKTPELTASQGTEL